jgi:hypothetical protein
MEGATSHGIMRYRCRVTQTRSLPAHLADHPKALSVRQDAILPPPDRWIAGLADPTWLANSQQPDADTRAEEHRLRTASPRPTPRPRTSSPPSRQAPTRP